MNGKTQSISVDSNVKGAEVLINQVVVGQTPFVGQAPAVLHLKLLFVKTGMTLKLLWLKQRLSPCFGAILFLVVSLGQQLTIRRVQCTNMHLQLSL